MGGGGYAFYLPFFGSFLGGGCWRGEQEPMIKGVQFEKAAGQNY